EAADRAGQGGRVTGVVPTDELVEQRRVEHRARDRAGLVEARGEGDEPVARDPSVGRLDAHGAGDGGGLADRATGVGPDRERRLEGRDGRGRTAPGAAGDPLEVPRV